MLMQELLWKLGTAVSQQQRRKRQAGRLGGFLTKRRDQGEDAEEKMSFRNECRKKQKGRCKKKKRKK